MNARSVVFVLIASAILAICVGCPGANYDPEDYIGEWVNDDPDGGVPRLIIEQGADGLVVDVKGTCGGYECDWFSGDLLPDFEWPFELHAVHETDYAIEDFHMFARTSPNLTRGTLDLRVDMDFFAENRDDNSFIETFHRAS